jgi:hypothetical protein
MAHCLLIGPITGCQTEGTNDPNAGDTGDSAMPPHATRGMVGILGKVDDGLPIMAIWSSRREGAHHPWREMCTTFLFGGNTAVLRRE